MQANHHLALLYSLFWRWHIHACTCYADPSKATPAATGEGYLDIAAPDDGDDIAAPVDAPDDGVGIAAPDDGAKKEETFGVAKQASDPASKPHITPPPPLSKNGAEIAI